MNMLDVMTLGQIIDQMEKAEKNTLVQFDFCYFSPGDLNSYRGYYQDLAIGPIEGEVMANDFLAALHEANGKTYEGYKGGWYVMDRDTRVWVARYGESGGTAIVRVEASLFDVILHTAKVD